MFYHAYPIFLATSMTSKTTKKAIPVATASVIAACAACCVASLALPTAVMMGTGGVLAWFVDYSGWVAGVGIALVLAGWVWTFRRGSRQARPSGGTLWLMAAITALLPTAFAWAWLQAGS